MPRPNCPAAFAAELALAAPDAPWHTTRWPVTELGDALVQAIDAVAVIATDVATLGRTEIGELSEGVGGGSSAMPQKQNPAASVLIRSAALRAPQLGATLHLAAAFAVDERPDGAWHAEWPTLRELLRLALGATGTAARLVAGLQVDADAVARNLAATRGLIVAERLSLAVGPVIGKERVSQIVVGRRPGRGPRRPAACPARVGGCRHRRPARPGRLYRFGRRPHRPSHLGGAVMTVPTIALTAPVGPDAAPLLVLGPSLGTSTILWENALPILAARYRVVAWDLPGHGSSPATTDPFTVADLADAVAAASRDLGVEKILYAGVSLGGATGLELGLRHPDLVSALAIVASGASLGTPESWHERAATVRSQSTSVLIIPSAQRWFGPNSVAREPELSGRLLHALRDADAESYALCCEALAAYDVSDRLGELGMPVVALWGEHDAVAPEPKALEIAGGVVDGRAEMIADVAHLPPAEAPAATAAALLEFFTGADAADVAKEHAHG